MRVFILLFLFGIPAQARTVVPNFTTGTVNSVTNSTTTVVEIIRQQEYSTSTSYTVTGHNINIPNVPGPGANYTLIDQGAPFQFSETMFTPGLVTDTEIERTTTTTSNTVTTSVFTQ